MFKLFIWNIFCRIIIFMFCMSCWYVLGCVCFNLYKLWCGHVSVRHWIKLLLFVLSGFVLRHDWAIGCDGDMCCGLLQCIFCDQLHIMHDDDLFRYLWFNQLYEL